ncbi:hypothetical protein HMPREF3216_00647 [Gardnerella vaginalis]|uniref:Uncharacterized protein n=1 Tax=Gardnerella vaginalis TaxID=2702 RepID=A0A133NPZ9_GARVA|nr:hypothetical protein HMPREF3216_00647 [Gardnerella vaginalis]
MPNIWRFVRRFVRRFVCDLHGDLYDAQVISLQHAFCMIEL